jgi:hypothetical protein
MNKQKTIDSFFKKKYASHLDVDSDTPLNRSLATDINASMTDEWLSKCPRIHPEEIDATYLECDIGKRLQIWEFPVNLQDEMRRAYLRAGPCQPILTATEYPASGPNIHHRRFQSSWFQTYPSWLEYSKLKDAIFCYPIYIFAKKSTSRLRSYVFIVKGFKNWKKVNDIMNCPLTGHVEKYQNPPNKIVVKCCEDLKNYSRHIGKLIEKQSSQEIENNRLRLQTSIDSVRWLTFQACAFKGHDESSNSKNQSNYVELIEFLTTYNDKVVGVVLTNDQRNGKYKSPQIQKEILHIIAIKVRDVIRKEIGDA